MLVLKRKQGERILIGPDIEVMVVKISRRDGVALGITAPLGVTIMRPDAKSKEPKDREDRQ